MRNVIRPPFEKSLGNRAETRKSPTSAKNNIANSSLPGQGSCLHSPVGKPRHLRSQPEDQPSLSLWEAEDQPNLSLWVKFLLPPVSHGVMIITMSKCRLIGALLAP